LGKYEIKYNGKEMPGLVERVVGDINRFLKEIEILETIEQALSEFIAKSTAELNQEAERGHVWLNRFNAREKGQDAFFIQFSPTAKEQTKVRFVQTAIGEGRFLTKEIRFSKDSCYQLSYIKKEVVPLLKSIFTKFGFKILKGGDPFS